MINSCLGQFSAACLRRLPLFRSYGDNLPSSLTTLLPLALESSSCLPVSVCGTGTSDVPQSFSRLRLRRLHYFFRSLSTGVTNTRLRRFQSVPLLKSFCGYGISTVCASATRFRLTLAPGSLGADEPSSKILRLSAIMILT